LTPAHKVAAAPARRTLTPWRTVGFVGAGVGLALVAVGATTGALALSNLSEAKSACPSYPDRCDSAGVGSAANGRARTFARVSNVGFVAGGALIAAGVVAVVTAPKPSSVALSMTPAP